MHGGDGGITSNAANPAAKRPCIGGDGDVSGGSPSFAATEKPTDHQLWAGNSGSWKSWELYGGKVVERLLANVDLVDARYLLSIAADGATLPRNQDLPESAKITAANIDMLRNHSWNRRFSLPVLVLSYPWLDRDHPDRNGAQLRAITPILQAMLRELSDEGGIGVVGGPKDTIGVMIDYCSLPQQPRDSVAQAKFERGLFEMHQWYSHPFTHVLLLTAPLPDGDYSNRRNYADRGWCYFERQTASLIKNADILWDIAHYRGATSYAECIKEMKAGRGPPRSPDQVGDDIRGRVDTGDLFFSYMADVDVVIEMYRRGFIAAFDSYRQLRGTHADAATSIYYGRLGWTDDDADIFAASLRFANDHCEMPDGPVEITTRGNAFTEAGIHKLMSAVSPRKFRVCAFALDDAKDILVISNKKEAQAKFVKRLLASGQPLTDVQQRAVDSYQADQDRQPHVPADRRRADGDVASGCAIVPVVRVEDDARDIE